MISGKEHKVVMVSLPKTGTSTIAVMLRILGYRVTGPNKYNQGDFRQLGNYILNYSGFQDYPWCFEYSHFDVANSLFIYFEREDQSWANSFISSYGHSDGTHISLKYMNGILSKTENMEELIRFKKEHRKIFFSWAEKQNASVLTTSFETLSWYQLCSFTNNAIPRNIFGVTLKIPKVNSSNQRKSNPFFKSIRNILWFFISPEMLTSLRIKIHRVLGKRI